MSIYNLYIKYLWVIIQWQPNKSLNEVKLFRNRWKQKNNRMPRESVVALRPASNWKYIRKVRNNEHLLTLCESNMYEINNVNMPYAKTLPIECFASVVRIWAICNYPYVLYYSHPLIFVIKSSRDSQNIIRTKTFREQQTEISTNEKTLT